MSAPSSCYCRHRYPPEIISYAVYLYYRFTVSYRDMEEMLARRGIVVSYETIRQWCLKFGPQFAAEIRRRRPAPRDHWHLDELRHEVASVAVETPRGGLNRAYCRPYPTVACGPRKRAVRSPRDNVASPT